MGIPCVELLFRPADVHSFSYYSCNRPVCRSCFYSSFWAAPNLKIPSRPVGSKAANVGYTNDEMLICSAQGHRKCSSSGLEKVLPYVLIACTGVIFAEGGAPGADKVV